MKSDFLRIARDGRRQSELLGIDSSRSPSPAYHRSSRRSKNLPKFKIVNFYSTDVEIWLNQIETQFDLHGITDVDESSRLTCAVLSGEVASDVCDVLLQPFRTKKYLNLKEVLIERRGLTTSERVNKVFFGREIRNRHSVSFPQPTFRLVSSDAFRRLSVSRHRQLSAQPSYARLSSDRC